MSSFIPLLSYELINYVFISCRDSTKIMPLLILRSYMRYNFIKVNKNYSTFLRPQEYTNFYIVCILNNYDTQNQNNPKCPVTN